MRPRGKLSGPSVARVGSPPVTAGSVLAGTPRVRSFRSTVQAYEQIRLEHPGGLSVTPASGDLSSAERRDFQDSLGASGAIQSSLTDRKLESVADMHQLRLDEIGTIEAAQLCFDVQSATQFLAKVGEPRGAQILEVFSDYAKKLIRRRGGQLLNYAGDGAIAAFDSVDDSIWAAVAVQRFSSEEMAPAVARETGLPFSGGVAVSFGTMRPRRLDPVGRCFQSNSYETYMAVTLARLAKPASIVIAQEAFLRIKDPKCYPISWRPSSKLRVGDSWQTIRQGILRSPRISQKS